MVAVVGALVGAERRARAAPPGADGDRLRTNASVDVPVAAGAVGLWAALELFQGALAPASCRVCDRRPDGAEGLNGVDASARDALRWSDPHAANVASNWTGFVAAPVVSLGTLSLAAAAPGRFDDMPGNTLVLVESVALAASLDQNREAGRRAAAAVRALP